MLIIVWCRNYVFFQFGFLCLKFGNFISQLNHLPFFKIYYKQFLLQFLISFFHELLMIYIKEHTLSFCWTKYEQYIKVWNRSIYISVLSLMWGTSDLVNLWYAQKKICQKKSKTFIPISHCIRLHWCELVY